MIFKSSAHSKLGHETENILNYYTLNFYHNVKPGEFKDVCPKYILKFTFGLLQCYYNIYFQIQSLRLTPVFKSVILFWKIV